MVKYNINKIEGVPVVQHALDSYLHAHAARGAQGRYNRRCDTCYHFKLKGLLKSFLFLKTSSLVVFERVQPSKIFWQAYKKFFYGLNALFCCLSTTLQRYKKYLNCANILVIILVRKATFLSDDGFALLHFCKLDIKVLDILVKYLYYYIIYILYNNRFKVIDF